MQIFRKPPPRPTTIQIRAADNVDARIITESLQKIADEFNATELHLMIKKLESFDTRLKIRAYLTVK
jgi:hypothetical protein